MKEVFEACQVWEEKLLAMGWQAPITLAQAIGELREAALETKPSRVEEELGDLLQVIFRFAARQNLDLVSATAESLKRNQFRTGRVLAMTNGRIPPPGEMARLWAKAKEQEKWR